MDNHNIRIDRTRLSSQEIAQHKDFDGLLNDHQIMKKPFYKNPWFFGVTGMASVGLLIGANYSFTDSPAEPLVVAETSESVPIKKEDTKTIYLASLESIDKQERNSQPTKTKLIPLKKKEIHDNTSTLKNKSLNKPSASVSEEEITEKVVETISAKNIPVTDEKQTVNKVLQNHPRIDGEIGGKLKIKSVSLNTRLVTDSKIPITGFEMHMATEFGSKIFRSNTDKLTKEMVYAIRAAKFNTEVFFESISGDIGNGKQMNLSPLKFTLAR